MNQVDINARIKPLGDAELVRLQLRTALFKRRGQTPAQAEFLADWMALRDQDKDDRRLCIECAHRQDDHGCFAAKVGWLGANAKRQACMPADVLHRCGKFLWQKP